LHSLELRNLEGDIWEERPLYGKEWRPVAPALPHPKPFHLKDQDVQEKKLELMEDLEITKEKTIKSNVEKIMLAWRT